MHLPLILLILSNPSSPADASSRPWKLSKKASIPDDAAFLSSRRESVPARVSSTNEVRSNQYEATNTLKLLRGGSTETEEDGSDSEYEEECDSDAQEEYDEESDEEQSDADETARPSSLTTSLQNKSPKPKEPYDALLTPPPMQQLLISVSVMFLSQRIDVFSPRVVAAARAAFVGYVVAAQLFLLYVRVRAERIDDRTEIAISGPLASFVAGTRSGDGSDGASGVARSLASRLLTERTTVREYDLRQVRSMQSSLLLPMVFVYFLHFRMKQMQPLLMQTATGVMNLVYCPLWQAYVLGRRLERPFASGAAGSARERVGVDADGGEEGLEEEREESVVVEEEMDESESEEEDRDSEAADGDNEEEAASDEGIDKAETESGSESDAD